MQTTSFERFAGLCALAAGAAAFLYAVAFVILRSGPLAALCLLAVGLLATAVQVGLYERLREVDRGWALWALALGLAGALGAALHGGFDLATAIVPPPVATGEVPSQADPRGLLTFGVTGLGLLVVAWLIGREARLPRGLSRVGYATAALSILLYLGRLIVFDATSPLILLPAVLNGFIVGPAWYIWLGLSLRAGAAEPVARAQPA
ncbi:MAG TPA: hypothetical protein VGL23_02835 [Chloroflexota bacterium]|jgi:hypothetical protein